MEMMKTQHTSWEYRASLSTYGNDEDTTHNTHGNIKPHYQHGNAENTASTQEHVVHYLFATSKTGTYVQDRYI